MSRNQILCKKLKSTCLSLHQTETLFDWQSTLSLMSHRITELSMPRTRTWQVAQWVIRDFDPKILLFCGSSFLIYKMLSSLKHCLVRKSRGLAGHLSSKTFLTKILQPRHLDIVKEERVMFHKLYRNLLEVNASNDVLNLVMDTQARIDDLFLVVVVGEFNSGKSTFINSLIGKKLLKDGVLPTTDSVYVVRSKPTKSADVVDRSNEVLQDNYKPSTNLSLDDVKEIVLEDIPWLENIAIVDTPGTNAIYSKHENLTQNFVPRSDLVIFVTSVERPLCDSETKFLKKISQWGKKVVIVVNKYETITSETDAERVLTFVSQNAGRILENLQSIPIFGVSAQLGLEAKLAGYGNLEAMSKLDERERLQIVDKYNKSLLEPLETYMRSNLARDELVISKLQGPLLIADRITTQTIKDIETKMYTLEGDRMILKMIDENMVLHAEDMERDIASYKLRIEKVFQNLQEEADLFFDENISILKPSLLLDQEEFKKKFNREVVVDISKPVDTIVHEVSDLIYKRSKKQADYILSHLGKKPQEYDIDMRINNVDLGLGALDGASGRGMDERNRNSLGGVDAISQELLSKLRTNTAAMMEKYDPSMTTESIVGNLKRSMVHLGIIEATSAATAASLLSLQMLDFTGLVATSSMAVMGLFVVPWRKSVVRYVFSVTFHLKLSVLCYLLSCLSFLCGI